MAYSNSPQFQTYKSVPVKFDGTDTLRTGDLSVNRDLQIVNLYYERISQENEERELRLRKRPGLKSTGYSFNKNTSTDVLRGSFYDPDQNGFYWAVNNKVYLINPDVGTAIRTVTTLGTSSGYVGFCSFLKSDNTRFVIITDGTDLWVDNYATLSCNKVVDPDLPTPHEPFPLYIDGYLLLVKHNTSDMYNSDADDPTSWTSDNFIQAEISSDWTKRLYKVKNYVINLGNNSVEYFWDAGNATGSPFSRNDSPFRGVGYVTGGCQIGDTVYFVGQDAGYNVAVYSINSFKVERISNAVVERTLQTISTGDNAKGQVTLNQDGFCLSSDGHTFYTLVTPQTTWVYDVDEHFWYEWKSSNNAGVKFEAAWTMLNGSMYCAIAGQTNFAIFTPSAYQDFSSNFTTRYTTENMTFDTFNWKVAHRLSVRSSKHLNGTFDTFVSNMAITWSTDDWATDTIRGPRYVNIFSNSPFTSRLGRFRNISFRFEYTDNYPLFMMGMDLDINVMGV